MLISWCGMKCLQGRWWRRKGRKVFVRVMHRKNGNTSCNSSLYFDVLKLICNYCFWNWNNTPGNMAYSLFLKLFAGGKQAVFYPLGTFSQLFPSPSLGLLYLLFLHWRGQDNLLLGPAGSWATLEPPFSKFPGSQLTGIHLLPELQLLPTWS